MNLDRSPKIVVETVAQASSLHGQDARPTVIDEKRTTLNSGEPLDSAWNQRLCFFELEFD